jgi:hypothetical protein
MGNRHSSIAGVAPNEDLSPDWFDLRTSELKLPQEADEGFGARRYELIAGVGHLAA